MLRAQRFTIQALAIVTRGAVLHRQALEAFEQGRFDLAAVLFEAALSRYRREMAVEQIARLRVHQLMAQVLSGAEPELANERCLEVERRLCNLNQIESIHSPFDLVDAHTMLGSWLSGATDSAADAEDAPDQDDAIEEALSLRAA